MKNLIDLTLLNEFANGDAIFLNKMKTIFIEETSVNIEKIEASIVAKDLKSISEIAHSMKPSLDYLAITDLREQVRSIEKQEFSGVSPSESISGFVNLLKELVIQLQK